MNNIYHQEQRRVERNIKDSGEIAHKPQPRQKVNQEKQPEQQKKTDQLNPVRAGNHRVEQQPVVPVPQQQERAQRKKPQTDSDGIFNQLEDGNQQRQSSERGRDSRRSLQGGNYDDRNDGFRKWQRSEH